MPLVVPLVVRLAARRVSVRQNSRSPEKQHHQLLVHETMVPWKPVGEISDGSLQNTFLDAPETFSNKLAFICTTEK